MAINADLNASISQFFRGYQWRLNAPVSFNGLEFHINKIKKKNQKIIIYVFFPAKLSINLSPM